MAELQQTPPPPKIIALSPAQLGVTSIAALSPRHTSPSRSSSSWQSEPTPAALPSFSPTRGSSPHSISSPWTALRPLLLVRHSDRRQIPGFIRLPLKFILLPYPPAICCRLVLFISIASTPVVLSVLSTFTCPGTSPNPSTGHHQLQLASAWTCIF